MAGRELGEKGDVAMEVFRGAEDQGDDGAGRVIDGAEQGHRRAPRFQPGELTAVEQDEGAHAQRGGPAPPIGPGAAPMLGREPERPADAADGGATDGHAVHLLQLLRRMAVIDVAVDRLQERRHAGPHGARQGAGGRLAPTAMAEAVDPFGPIPGFEALKLPDAEVRALRALRVGDLPRHRQSDQPRPRHFLPAHLDGLPSFHGVTFSLTS